MVYGKERCGTAGYLPFVSRNGRRLADRSEVLCAGCCVSASYYETVTGSTEQCCDGKCVFGAVRVDCCPRPGCKDPVASGEIV